MNYFLEVFINVDLINMQIKRQQPIYSIKHLMTTQERKKKRKHENFN